MLQLEKWKATKRRKFESLFTVVNNGILCLIISLQSKNDRDLGCKPHNLPNKNFFLNRPSSFLSSHTRTIVRYDQMQILTLYKFLTNSSAIVIGWKISRLILLYYCTVLRSKESELTLRFSSKQVVRSYDRMKLMSHIFLESI